MVVLRTRYKASMKRDAPATHRNREPILEVLQRWLPEPARVLEVASGTGQHAIFFSAAMPHLDWQPTDHDPASLESTASWVSEEGNSNVRAPVLLDASSPTWPDAIRAELGSVDAIFNANMIHISPWAVAEGLFAGAGDLLGSGGLLFLYGPFKVGGEHTSPSNASFHESLRERDPLWGVRDLERVDEVATAAGLSRIESNELPANNRLLVFRQV